MKTIGHKGHRVGHIADHDFHKENKRGQPEHGDETTLFARVPAHGGALLCARLIGRLNTNKDREIR